MIARLIVVLPFEFTLPEGAQFKIYSTNIDGYEIIPFPPVKTDTPVTESDSIKISIDSVPAFKANGLRIDFHKDEFDRRTEELRDPPLELMRSVVDSLLLRLRIVTRASNMTPPKFPNVTWRLEYLNDDGTKLESQAGSATAFGGLTRQFAWTALTADVWDQVNLLPHDFEAPPWVTLLLDARRAMPDVGAAIVLAHTALEVCVAHVLDILARDAVAPNLWQWINHRGGDLQKQPSPGEQFDILLSTVSGTSLKDTELWESFQNLRTARNTFVHEGKPKIGGSTVNQDAAQRLIHNADKIVMFLRDKLPEDQRWPNYQFDFKVIGTSPIWPEP